MFCGTHVVTLFSFALGRRHVRNTLSVGSSRYLAHCRPWLGACCSVWRAGGQAGNQGCSKPNSSLAPVLEQHSHQHREREIGWPTENDPCPFPTYLTK